MNMKILILLLLSAKAASGWSWTALPAAAGKAPRVSGQAASSTNDGVLLFGGLTGAAGSPTTNDLWKFDASDDAWARVAPGAGDGSPVSRVRMYAASASIGDEFYVFGGWDPMEPGSGGEFLDDVWAFDRANSVWRELEAKLPYPVSRHAAVAVGDMAVIQTYKGIITFKDGVLTEQVTTGEAPDSLSMCAMAAVGDKVVVFAGSDKTQRMSSDVYVLNTVDWKWTKLQNQSVEGGPSAMASASMAPLAEDRCIVFGGAGLAPAGYQGGFGLMPKDNTWICTITEKAVEWKSVVCEKRPEGRLAASLSCLGDGRYLLQGGYDPVSKSTFEEPWILSEK
ncbi:hypothetical protein ACHAWF_005866 [Thalassiosira exigua]